MTKIKAKYIGENRADIRNGEIYEVAPVKDEPTMYAVKDKSGELYAYPRRLFEIINEQN